MAVAKSLREIITGIPADPNKQVVNSELLAKLLEMEAQGAVSGALYFEDTLANLTALSGVAEGSTGFVLNDGTSSNNGVYRYASAAWGKTSDLPGAFQGVTIAAADISDGTATGVAVLTGNAAAGRTALGLGALALLDELADGSVGILKLADRAEATFMGRKAGAGTGRVQEVSAAEARTILNVEDGATADQTGAEIKAAYEAEANTNAFTDAEKTKLAGIATGAQVNTVASVAGKTGAVALDSSDVGLGNVDNTSDADKPLSTAQKAAVLDAAAINLRAVGGTADAATATLPASLSLSGLSANDTIVVRWPGTNTVSDPTLTIGATAYTLKRNNGGTIQAGDLRSGTYVLSRFSASVLKVVQPLNLTDIGEEWVYELAPAAPEAFDLITGANTQPLNGAAKRFGTRGRAMGLSFPTGQTGENSVLVADLPFGPWEREHLTGQTIKVRVRWDTSATWTRTYAINFQWVDETGTFTALTQSNIVDDTDGTTITREFTAVLPSGVTITAVRSFLSFTSTSPTAADETIDITALAVSVEADDDPVLTEAALTSAWQGEMARKLAALAEPDGSGRKVWREIDAADYASIADAVTAAGLLASPGRWVQVNVGDGWFTERSIGVGVAPDFVRLVGRGKRRTFIDGSQADSAPVADITNNSVLDSDGDFEVEGICFMGANVRYVWHCDAVTGKPNTLVRAIDCDFFHLGNAGAETYRGGTPGESTSSYAIVWGQMHALGSGMSSGQRFEAHNCNFIAPRVGIQMHNQVQFARPCSAVFRNCEMTGEWATGYAAMVQSNGAGVTCSIQFENCSLSGMVRVDDTSLLDTTIAADFADKNEWEITVSGCSPALVKYDSPGRALRIVSATTGASSSVVVSGSAATTLFGDVVTRAGAAGLAGAVTGTRDIQDAVGYGANKDQFVTGMGREALGDCSSSSKTLVVTVDGGTPINIVFTTDLTAVSNTTILATINAALGSAATASEVNPGTERRLFTPTEEKRMKNNSATAILQGMALATDTGARTVRAMTSADDVSRFAGIALETIAPGDYGRVKYRGWIDDSWALRKPGEGSAIALGDTFAIDAANAGYITKTGGGLLRCVTPSLGSDLTTLEIAA